MVNNTLPEYNGHPNYFTWTIYQHISSSQDTAFFLEERLTSHHSLFDAIDYLAEFVRDEDNPLRNTSSMYSDILTYALGYVDWEHLVKALVPEDFVFLRR